MQAHRAAFNICHCRLRVRIYRRGFQRTFFIVAAGFRLRVECAAFIPAATSIGTAARAAAFACATCGTGTAIVGTDTIWTVSVRTTLTYCG